MSMTILFDGIDLAKRVFHQGLRHEKPHQRPVVVLQSAPLFSL
jgi:hypothetical protein